MKKKAIDISKKKFNKLTAIKLDHIKVLIPKRLGTVHFWIFECECGTRVILPKNKVMQGRQISCGCWRSEVTTKRSTKHGMAKSRFNTVWKNIMQRCSNKKHPAWKHYGGKGVKVEWQNFIVFKKDMYESYLDHCKNFGEKLTEIDRINNDGNYSKENCRWVTRSENCRNFSRNRILEYKGQNKCLMEWAEIFKIDRRLISLRIKRGWTIEKAIEVPVNR